MFIDRQAELDLLKQRYTSGQAELFVLYGRRRVGKTELLARFCRGKRHIFYVADLDVEPALRAGLSAAVNAELLGPQAASAVYPAWDDIFLLLAHHAQAERLVVVLDEFTYLVSAHPPLASCSSQSHPVGTGGQPDRSRAAGVTPDRRVYRPGL